MKTHLVIPQLKYEGNIYAAIRSAEALGVTEIDLIGNHNINSWGTKHISKGGFNHINIVRFNTLEDCLDYLIGKRLKIICIENSNKAVCLKGFKFPSNVAIIMGHENLGVPEIFLNRFINVKIPQFGLMRCLNTSVAVSIVLYERFVQGLKI